MFLASAICLAQTPEGLQRAVSLQYSYEFDAAAALCRELSATADSSMQASLAAVETQCSNGSSMLRYAYEPSLVSSRTVARGDFFLWFDQMKDQVWMAEPNAFTGDTLVGEGGATFFDTAREDIVFSAPDSTGARSLFASSWRDTMWSLPQSLGEAFASPGNEIFPVVSPDGTRLYFASDGLAGMGGYDIYVSHLGPDGRTWGAPQNLGFPFSSPEDDLMYMDTPDGRYSMLASARGCKGDSVTIYVFKFENSPVRSQVAGAAEARRIASFQKKRSEKPAAASAGSSTAGSGEWAMLRARVASLKDSIASAPDDAALLALQRTLTDVRERLLQVETGYLERGEEIPQESVAQSADRPSEAAPEKYAFHKNRWAPAREIVIEQPDPGFDYTFAIGKQAVIVEDPTLPEGVRYQAQLCAVSQKLPLKKLRGMTPVFEVKQPSGKWIYYVGLFSSYKEAQAALPRIQKCGFSGAYLVAWKDGKKISVKTAKQWNP